MPVPGRKPKAQTRSPQRTTHDYVEVEAVPYSGARPDLPTSRRVMLPFGNVADIELHDMTRAWWETLTRMPHCILWSDSDWQFAIATALVADAFYYGHGPSATELARRERVLGTTVDSRRDLRIRYVDPKSDTAPSEVTNLDDYRNL